MPAHLRPLSPCKVCGKPAAYELFNTRNAPLGVYCGRHAEPALAKYKKENE